MMLRCGSCASGNAAFPALDPHDPGYRRLRYVRYADDILLGFTGPKAEAEEIKRRLAQFLHEDLALELSETKTLITHARTGSGAVPRLRDPHPVRQPQADRWPQVGQRSDPLARPGGCDQGQMLPIHEAGQARQPTTS